MTKRWMAVVAGVMMASRLVMAADPGEAVKPVVDRLLKAVEANNYEAFLVDADDTVKAALTRQMLDGVNAIYAPRMKQGYDCTYLGILKKGQGFEMHLWKVAYKDAGADTLVKLTLKGDKVAGFILE